MDDYDSLKVSIQSALVGEIPDNLFAVTCGMGHKRITVAAYFDGPVGDEESHLVRRVGTEVAADFPDDYSTEVHCYSMQQVELRMLDFWAFLRASTRRSANVAKRAIRLAAGF
jgi:hypothetical protein